LSSLIAKGKIAIDLTGIESRSKRYHMIRRNSWGGENRAKQKDTLKYSLRKASALSTGGDPGGKRNAKDPEISKTSLPGRVPGMHTGKKREEWREGVKKK